MRFADLSIAGKIGTAFAALIFGVGCIGVAVEHDMRVLDSTGESFGKAEGAFGRQAGSGTLPSSTAPVHQMRSTGSGDAVLAANTDAAAAGWEEF